MSEPVEYTELPSDDSSESDEYGYSGSEDDNDLADSDEDGLEENVTSSSSSEVFRRCSCLMSSQVVASSAQVSRVRMNVE